MLTELRERVPRGMSATTAKTTPRRKGRPTVFDDRTRRRLIKCIALGMPLTHVVNACRVSWSGFCDYRNRNPRFAEAVERARSLAMAKHLKIVVAAAESGNEACSRWFLERCFPQHFGRVRVEVSGPDGEPLSGAQVAVLVWPHQRNQNPNHQNEILDAPDDRTAITSSDPG